MDNPIAARTDTKDKWQNETKKLSPTTSIASGQVSLDDIAMSIAAKSFSSKVFQTSNSAVLYDSDFDTTLEAAVNHRRLKPRQIQLTAIAGSIGAYVAHGNLISSP